MLLALVTLFCLSFVAALAERPHAHAPTPAGDPAVWQPRRFPLPAQSPPLTQTDALSEVVELRTATSRHYQLGPSLYRALISAMPIHYQDASGNWQEIDLRPVPRPEGGYQVEASPVRMIFPERIDGAAVQVQASLAPSRRPESQPGGPRRTKPDTASLFQDDRSLGDAEPAPPPLQLFLTWRPQRLALAGQGGLAAPAYEVSAAVARPVENGVEYAGAFGRARLTFSPLAVGFVQRLELEAPPDTQGVKTAGSLGYTVRIELPPGLQLYSGGLPQAGSFATYRLEVRDGAGNRLLALPAPRLYDRLGSRDLPPAPYRVERTPQGIELTADLPLDWLSDPARQYPVVAESPVIFATSPLPFLQDTWIGECWPEDNYGSADTMRVGYRACGPAGAERGLIQWIVDFLPRDAVIIEPTESLLWRLPGQDTGADLQTIGTHRLLQAWDADYATWLARTETAGWSQPGAEADYLIAPDATVEIASGGPEGYMGMGSLASLVGAWHTDQNFSPWGIPNYGVMVRSAQESPPDDLDRAFAQAAASPESAPMLAVTYYTGTVQDLEPNLERLITRAPSPDYFRIDTPPAGPAAAPREGEAGRSLLVTEPAAGRGDWLYRPQAGLPMLTSRGGMALAYPSAYRWQPEQPSAGPNILIYADDFVHAPPKTFLDKALQSLGLAYTAHYGGDWAGFEADLAGGTWGLVLVGNDNWEPPDSTLQALDNYVKAGGKLILHSWVVGYDPGHALWATLGFDWAGNDQEPPDVVYWWEPLHQAFTSPQSVPEWTSLTAQLRGVYGQRGAPLTGFQALAGYAEAGPQPDEAAMVVGNDGRTVFKGFLDVQNSADLDADGVKDGVELWVNLIEGIQGGFSAGWRAVGIRAADARSDYDLLLSPSADYAFSNVVAWATQLGSAPDLLVIRPDVAPTLYPWTIQWEGTGAYYINYATQLGELAPGGNTLIMGAAEAASVLNVYQVSMIAGQDYQISLDVISGDADLGLGLFAPGAAGGEALETRDGAAAMSDSPGFGGGESLVFRPAISGWYGLVVWNNGGTQPSSFQLRLDQAGTGTHVYLPILFKNYAPPAPDFANGGFETGTFSPWTSAGPGWPLAASVIANPAPSCFSGSYTARLGTPGQLADGTIPVGEAKFEQTFFVPADASEITFSYRVFSYDIIRGCNTNRYYDRFSLAINGTPVLTDGNPACSSDGQTLWQSGCQSTSIPIGSFAGQNVTLKFSVFNLTYPSFNTWAEVDNVQIQ